MAASVSRNTLPPESHAFSSGAFRSSIRDPATTQDIVEGAVWRDPERIEEWKDDLSKDTPVVTFCVYGFHILRKAGFDARYVAGGHYAWKAIKGRVKRFESPEGR